MLTQERGNFVLWNVRQNAQNTDPSDDEHDNEEMMEEESLEDDPGVSSGDVIV